MPVLGKKKPACGGCAVNVLQGGTVVILWLFGGNEGVLLSQTS